MQLEENSPQSKLVMGRVGVPTGWLIELSSGLEPGLPDSPLSQTGLFPCRVAPCYPLLESLGT